MTVATLDNRWQCANGCPDWRTTSVAQWDRLCERCCIRVLNRADSEGDGPLVNAMCWYGRRRFGENIHW